MINDQDFVGLGLDCADISRALDRGMNGKRLDDLSQSVREAINQLKMLVKPAIHSLGSLLTMHLVAELRGKSGRRSLRRVDGVYSPDSPMRRMIRKRLPPGSFRPQ